MLPVLILLVSIVAIVYLYARRYINTIKVKVFIICILSWVFGLIFLAGVIAVIYAFLDKNDFAVELFGATTFLFLIFWLLIRFWAWRFYRKNPKYKDTPMHAKIVRKIRKIK